MAQLTNTALAAWLKKEWYGFDAFGPDALNVAAACTAAHLLLDGQTKEAMAILYARFGEEMVPLLCDRCHGQDFMANLNHQAHEVFYCDTCNYIAHLKPVITEATCGTLPLNRAYVRNDHSGLIGAGALDWYDTLDQAEAAIIALGYEDSDAAIFPADTAARADGFAWVIDRTYR